MPAASAPQTASDHSDASNAGSRDVPTEERLLNAADDLMHARGYEAVGLTELCAAADARKGSFYHFFESKEALALSMLDRSWQRSQVHLFEPTLGDSTVPVRERFDRYADGLAANLRCHVDGGVRGCRFGNFAAELSTSHPEIRTKIAAVLAEMTGRFADVLRQGIASGEISSDLDVESTATLICAQMEGLMLLAKAHREPDLLLTLTHAVDRLIDS